MSRRKDHDVPILKIKKGDSLRTIYAKARRAFSAAELQRYTETEEGVPADTVLAELEQLDRADSERRRKRRPRR